MLKFIRNRRIRKIVFYLAVGLIAFVLILSLASIGLRLYFNDSYIKNVLLETSKEYIDADINVGELDISVFSSIYLKDISLSSETDTLFNCEEISLHYSLGRLLSRELQITSIIIDNPKIGLETDSVGEFDLSWLNIPEDSSASLPDTAISTYDTTISESRLPVKVNLSRFEINNLELEIDGAQKIVLEDIDIELDDIEITSADSISGHARIILRDENDTTALYSLTDTSGTMSYWGKVGIDIDAEIYPMNIIKGSIRFTGAPINMDLYELIYSAKLMIKSNFDFNLSGGELLLNDIIADLNDDEFLTGRFAMGFAEEDTILPMEVYVNEAQLPLSELEKLMGNDSITTELTGRLNIAGFKLISSNEYPGMKMEGRASIQNAVISDSVMGYDLNDLNLIASWDGIMFGEDAGYVIEIKGRSDSIYYALDDTTSIAFPGIELGFNGTLDSLFTPNSLTGSLTCIGLFGDDLNSSIEIKGGMPPIGMMIFEVSYPNITIDNIPYSDYPGYGEFHLSVQCRGNNIEFNSDAAVYELTIYLEEDSLWIPELPINLSGNIVYDDDFNKLSLNKLSLSSPRLFKTGLFSPADMSLNPVIDMKAPVETVIYHDLLEDFIPDKMKDSLGSITFKGETTIQCTLQVAESNDSLIIGLPNAQLLSKVTEFRSELYEFELDNTDIDFKFSYSDQGLKGDGELSTSAFSLADSMIKAFEEINGNFSITYKDTFIIWSNTNINIQSHNLSFRSRGKYLLTEHPVLSMNTDLIFSSKETIEVMQDIGLNGRLEGNLDLTMDDTLMEMTGSVNPINLSVVSPGFFTVKSINGNMPFTQSVTFPDMELVGESRNANRLNLLDYEQEKFYQNSASGGNLSFQRFETERLFVENFNLDAEIGNGRITGYRLYTDVYGGNILGGFEIDLGGINFAEEELDLDSMRYSTDFQISSINFDMLAGSKSISKKSNISGDFSFDGRGIVDPEKDYELEGQINITKIGSRATKKLLDFLDPTGTDISIAETRKLMDRKLLFLDISYQPKTFSIKIKHGNINPSIDMDQPFFAKYLRIGAVTMPIEYDRKQLQTLLKAAAVPIEE